MAHRPHRNMVNRERQIVSAAYDLAEKQIADGTISPTVLHRLIMMGSNRNRLEEEGVKNRNKLMEAQTKAIEQAQQLEAKYTEALAAMRRYSGQLETADE